MPLVDAPALALPRPYLVWLSGTTIARLGDAVLTFALGWAASGHGGTTAALVLGVGALPRVILLVVGGAVADHLGARRLLLAGESALLVLTVALAAALARLGAPTWLLLASSLALGTVSAFCLPATGSMPRRLVPDDQLSRALAVRQGLGQAVLLTAAPLGGALVGGFGLAAVAWGDAVLLGIGLCVLVAVRERSGPVESAAADRRRLDLVGGLRVVAQVPRLRGALVLVGAAAALMVPVPSLLVPLLGRAAGWGPVETGAVAGAVGGGVIGAAWFAARRRARAHAGLRGALVMSAAGAAVLAAGPTAGSPSAVAVSVVGALAFGVGNGVVVSRLAPVVLGSAPRTHLARVQALVGLVQVVPVMVTSAALGALAERTSTPWALGVTAAGLASLGIWSAGAPGSAATSAKGVGGAPDEVTARA
ncbi:MFS transporter [Cellulomonas biazotea]|uniref:MFS transporter n=1 Tax=Cellulomonas biazotea TaxID=1709 RepID=A0A402DLR3_9CELL|nr:MFS transporter [Cellulomonas biazotea]GCE75067.1 hypothetical protein CBZ_01230 [Cellulomonas biazotea]